MYRRNNNRAHKYYKKNKYILYDQNFKTETLYKICKVSGLSDNLQIFTKKDLPILFKSYIGNLGKIYIFIKSLNQIKDENKLEISNIISS